MKRVLSILLSLLIFSAGVLYAEDDGDEYDDGYVYEINGAGDQFIKIHLGAEIPLNFINDGENKLYTGGLFEIGYFRFLTKDLAVGGELTATYNVSIGKKILIMMPITFGVMYQPTIGDFEFPMFAELGFSYETWQNMNYFPSLAAKVSAGAFYRINEMCSVGASTSAMWIPQWYSNPAYNSNGLFMTVAAGVRYHF